MIETMFRNIFIKSTIVILITFFSASGKAQDSPVKWETSYSGKDSTISFKAQMDEHWHIYATVLPSDEGPLPTEFIFEELVNSKLEGKLVEPKPIEEYDPNFELDVRYFENSVTFRQKISLSEDSSKVVGYITYMACNDEGCLPPIDEPFKIVISQAKP